MGKIIAFSGKAGAGKDTAGEFVKEVYPEAVHLSFASSLKEMTTKYFSFADVVKKDPISRATLQGLGTLMREVVDENFWVKRTLSGLDKDGVYYITDLRYLNELHTLLSMSESYDVVVIRLEGRGGLDNTTASHPSETELDGVDFKYTYLNSGSLEDLKNYITGVIA